MILFALGRNIKIHVTWEGIKKTNIISKSLKDNFFSPNPTISCSHILIIHTAVISHKFHALRSPYWRRQQQRLPHHTHWGWIMCVWQMPTQSQSKVTEWMNGRGKCVKKNLYEIVVCGTKWYMCARERERERVLKMRIHSVYYSLSHDRYFGHIFECSRTIIYHIHVWIYSEWDREKRKWEGKKEHNLFIEDTFMK